MSILAFFFLQLLEFSYRYVTNVLDDARAVSAHAHKKSVDLDDVRLAVQMYSEQNVTSPPSREVLLDVARAKNAAPLPIPKPTCGLRLPPDRHCLTACNYRVRFKSRPRPPGYGGVKLASSGGGGGRFMGTPLGAGAAAAAAAAAAAMAAPHPKVVVGQPPAFSALAGGGGGAGGGGMMPGMGPAKPVIKIGSQAQPQPPPPQQQPVPMPNIQITPQQTDGSGNPGQPMFKISVNPQVLQQQQPTSAASQLPTKRKADEMENSY